MSRKKETPAILVAGEPPKEPLRFDLALGGNPVRIPVSVPKGMEATVSHPWEIADDVKADDGRTLVLQLSPSFEGQRDGILTVGSHSLRLSGVCESSVRIQRPQETLRNLLFVDPFYLENEF